MFELERYNFCIDSLGDTYTIMPISGSHTELCKKEDVKILLNESERKILNLESSFGRIKTRNKNNSKELYLDDLDYNLDILSNFSKYYNYSALDITGAKFDREIERFFKSTKSHFRVSEYYANLQYEDGDLIDDMKSMEQSNSGILLLERYRFNLKRGFITRTSDIYELWFYISISRNKVVDGELYLLPKQEIRNERLDMMLPRDYYSLFNTFEYKALSRVDISRIKVSSISNIIYKVIYSNIDLT